MVFFSAAYIHQPYKYKKTYITIYHTLHMPVFHNVNVKWDQNSKTHITTTPGETPIEIPSTQIISKVAGFNSL